MAPTQRCFAKGSSAPGPVPKDHIRLYSMRFCPFAQRARLVLHAKGIKHETININLNDKPEWYLKTNPLGLVPTLETVNGQVIYESLITCEYLDEVYTGKKLLPSDPFKKAQQKMLLEHFSKVIQTYYKIPGARKNGEDVSGLASEMKEKLSSLNQVLVNGKTKFFGGDSIMMIDYMIWPWFERMEMLELGCCLDGCDQLKKWVELMLQDPTVKATMQSTDNHMVFFKTYIAGKPDYDYGL